MPTHDSRETHLTSICEHCGKHIEMMVDSLPRDSATDNGWRHVDRNDHYVRVCFLDTEQFSYANNTFASPLPAVPLPNNRMASVCENCGGYIEKVLENLAPDSTDNGWRHVEPNTGNYIATCRSRCDPYGPNNMAKPVPAIPHNPIACIELT